MIDTLPEVLLKRVLSFVGDAWDFRSCERTCRSLRNVLKDDSLWACCEECKPKYQTQQPWMMLWRRGRPHFSNKTGCTDWPTSLQSYRERAFVVRAFDNCHRWQRSSKQVILSCMKNSVYGWKTLVNKILRLLLPNDLGNCRHLFHLRGDSSAVLMTIVERALITQLQRAQAIALNRCHGTDTFPSVSQRDFRLQDLVANTLDDDYLVFEHTDDEYFLPAPLVQPVLDERSRSLLVRRLAYQAGITKMENDLFHEVWATLVHLVCRILQPACIELAARKIPNDNVSKRKINRDEGESIRDIPPLPFVIGSENEFYQFFGDFNPHVEDRRPPGINCAHCGLSKAIHTIVPRQVEQGAKRLGVPVFRVCGDEWHIDTDLKGSTDVCVADEVAEAESRYRFVKLPFPISHGVLGAFPSEFFRQLVVDESASEAEESVDTNHAVVDSEDVGDVFYDAFGDEASEDKDASGDDEDEDSGDDENDEGDETDSDDDDSDDDSAARGPRAFYPYDFYCDDDEAYVNESSSSEEDLDADFLWEEGEEVALSDFHPTCSVDSFYRDQWVLDLQDD